MSNTQPITTITVLAERSANIDTICYRGTAALSDLSRLSQVDVYDQVTNPEGLQRDLNKKHALEAYDYAAQDPDDARPRAFPEVMLNVRDPKVVTLREVSTVEVEGLQLDVVALTFDLPKIDRAKTAKVSRMDGNHRLFFGNGDGNDRGPLDVAVPFSITVGLDRDQEKSLFLDVNANQKGLNTSHLSVLRGKLTPDEIEIKEHPARYFARRLVDDAVSPFHAIVHMGGSKAGSKEAGVKHPINFVALESGVKRILSKSQYLADLTSYDAQYALIRNYWVAVKSVYPEAWETPADFLVLKNLGVNVFSAVGGTLIDRCMAAQDVEIETMAAMLAKPKKALNWAKDSTDVLGMSGNRAALALAAKMVEAMPKKPPKARAQANVDQDAIKAEQAAADAAEQADVSAGTGEVDPGDAELAALQAEIDADEASRSAQGELVTND